MVAVALVRTFNYSKYSAYGPLVSPHQIIAWMSSGERCAAVAMQLQAGKLPAQLRRACAEFQFRRMNPDSICAMGLQ
jgi:hypothetical protein